MFDSTLPSELSGAKRMTDFNASQNNFMGNIPLLYYSWKSMVRLDLHANGLTGVIDNNVVWGMINMMHLSLHDNLLSGVIPPSLSNLQNVQVVELNHNQLRGTLPSELSRLHRLRRLRVHANQLSGVAPPLPWLSLQEPLEYVSDCGGTSDESSDLTCGNCTFCCNSEGKCYDNKTKKNSLNETYMFAASLIGFLILIFLLGVYIIEDQEQAEKWGLLEFKSDFLCGDTSVYWFPLSRSIHGWLIYSGTVGIQFVVFFLFMDSAFGKSSEDLKYRWICPKDRDMCLPQFGDRDN
jgi:hypothetical protein